jgi:hypothetical protein
VKPGVLDEGHTLASQGILVVDCLTFCNGQTVTNDTKMGRWCGLICSSTITKPGDNCSPGCVGVHHSSFDVAQQ